MNRLLIALIIIIAAIIFAFFLGKGYCEKDNIIERQKEEKEVIETIIKETKQVNERRVQALTVSHDDNLLWLEETICKDCR